MRLNPNQPLGEEFLSAVQGYLDDFISTQRDLLTPTGRHLDMIWDHVSRLVRGGKRMRPAFCYWGYVAAAGLTQDPPKALIEIAASLDLLHLFALVHDDLIDESDTRRGQPATHRFFEDFHNQQDWQGAGEPFGRSAAILLGDLLFAWSVSMAELAPLSPERMKRARPYLDAMRIEVLAGQMLDLVIQEKPLRTEELLGDARLVIEYKTAKYTVARPVQIGAALGLASEATLQSLGQFGAHVGNAFQMRDDLLGIFGDPVLTGKPSGDDLRQGKKTVLIAYAMSRANVEDQAQLLGWLGKPDISADELDQARQIMIGCGAVEETEKAILTQATAAMKLLHRLDLSAEGVEALMTLVHAAVERVA
ncbi:MAG: polyprenyl synthetase family protein [Propionibacteriaceae bacterium]|jgi:geranylgeranyl diphosphate synthase type I|nr:polyprenyl synthetase family protein [Propionibacteriaceae bacterium]